MQTSLSAQLIALGLDGLSVKDGEADEAMPDDGAMTHVVTAACVA